MLKSILKTQNPSLFDRKVKQIVQNIIWRCDSLKYFESKFKDRLKSEVGLGDQFKELYFTTSSEDKVQVWRRKSKAEITDRLIFDIILMAY